MAMKHRTDIKYLMELLWQKRTFVVGFTSIVAIISIVVSLIMPVWYRATAVIMPPSSEPTSMGIGSLLSGLPMGGFGLDAQSQATNNYMSILQSRTLNSEVIHRFDLLNEYQSEDFDRALEELAGHTKFIIRDEGTISISVYDRDQDEVADMANYYVVQLDSINKQLTMEKARNNRIFIETRVNQVYAEAAEAEDALQKFQEATGTFALQVQTEETIRALALLDAQVIEKEIELDYMLSTLNPDHPDVKYKRKEIESLRESLKRFISGSKVGEVISTLDKVPEYTVDYARLFREVEAKNAVLTFLLPEYEQARIQEAKDSPTTLVLDAATRPYRKSKPFRALIVVLSTMVAFFISTYTVIFLDRHFGSGSGNIE